MNCSAKTIEEIKSRVPISESVEAKMVSAEFNKQQLVRLDPPPDAIRRVIQHSGHYSFWDNPDQYFQELEKFIETTEKKYYR